jgi:hypothetical protein
MSKKKKVNARTHEARDGTRWSVEVLLPSHSSAMVVFHHPEGGTARRDRYNWYQADVPQARDVEARLDPAAIMDRLTDDDLTLLFRRSMPISAAGAPAAHIG